MAIWSGLGTGARAAVVAAGAGVVAVAGWFTLSGQPDAPSVQAAPETLVEQAPVVKPVAAKPAADVAVVAADPAVAPAEIAPEPAPVLGEPAPATVAPAPPKFDVVRVEPDGTATIAGNAAPGSTVSLRIDGAEIITTFADGNGNFVALFTLPASQVPRLLSLAMTAGDGQPIVGPDTVAIAPTVAAVVAEVAPEATVVAEAVVEPSAPAALLITESGAEVLQSATELPPDVAANVSVDTISYGPAGDVQLGGRGQEGAFVRLYLDAAEIATVPVAADGQWATVLTDIAPGIYNLRADQIGPNGKVTSRFETPFKRETLEALAAVAAPAPVTKVEPAPPVAAVEPVLAEPATELAAVEPAAVEPAEVESAVVELAAVEPAAVEPTAVVPAAPVAVVPENSAPTIALAVDPVVPEAAPAIVVAADPAPKQPDSGEPAPAEVAVAALADPEPAGVVPKPAPVVKAALVSITVQPGFTLWGIAQQQMGDGVMYVQVFEANKDKIRDPDLIYPGQVFTMPAQN